VKAKAAEKLAAVAMLTENSPATCGKTGSSARADRAAENVASAMILSAGGMPLAAVTVSSPILGRRSKWLNSFEV